MSIFESFLFKTMLWDINAQPTLFPSNFLNHGVNLLTIFH